jgi:hypothetical protein
MEILVAPQSIWILGAGRHGRRAADALRQNNPAADMTMVESCPEVCAQMATLTFTVVCRDGVKFLLENLQEGRGPDWIIPMIPVHVAYEWIRLKVAKSHRFHAIAVPEMVVERLPNPVSGPDGQIYISNANFRCPPNCPEPDDICTYTGKPRPRILHQFLEKIYHPGFRSVVVHSRQLLPGIGGYSPAALFQTLRTVASANECVLLSTACRCHGVMHAFRIRAI